MLRGPGSSALRDLKNFYGSQRGVSHFVLKGKTDDGIEQIPVGNNLVDTTRIAMLINLHQQFQ
jgi:hypothetical protein